MIAPRKTVLAQLNLGTLVRRYCMQERVSPATTFLEHDTNASHVVGLGIVDTSLVSLLSHTKRLVPVSTCFQDSDG